MDTGYAHRLVLFRHAKSGYPDGVADHDRPLAKRGRRDAPVTGRWLAERGYVPDAVVCSTARRARETWELASGGLTAWSLAAGGPFAGDPARAAGGTAPEVRFESRVYGTTVLGLLMLVREFPESQRTVMLVGHNPGLAELAIGLADPPPAPPSGFPTAAVAVIGLPGPWADAAPSGARLLAFAAPADMRP
ncbi:MAG: histidine phosphatase family protein [Nocardiopsaceae bacterium]|nr:histidine phosphatase family protein [Nocardiopsaceae bacterium]